MFLKQRLTDAICSPSCILIALRFIWIRTRKNVGFRKMGDGLRILYCASRFLTNIIAEFRNIGLIRISLTKKNPERGQLASNFADEYPSTGYKTSIVNSLLKIPPDQEPPGYHQWWLWRSVELYHGDAYKVRIKVISPAKKEKTLYLLTALKIG